MRLLEIYQNLPEGTWNGDHPPAGDVADANCVMVQEMGSHAHLDTNQAIIARMEADERLVELPKLVSESLLGELRRRGHGRTIEYVFNGPSAKGLREKRGHSAS
jgi:hypothetical protein